MTFDYGACVGKLLERINKSPAVPIGRGIEKERAWMTQIPFGYQIRKHHDLMTRPAHAPGYRQRACCCHAITHPQFPKLTPASDSEERMLRARNERVP